MAQTYDIYLRKRLTEFDIIIRNLPYRDGLIVYSKTYLNAMVNYLCLQRFIIGETHSELQTKINDLLERIYNVFNSGIELAMSADAASKKPIVGSTDARLDVSMISMAHNELDLGEMKTRADETIRTRDGNVLIAWKRLVGQTSFHEECFNAFQNFTNLTTSALNYDLSKSVGSGIAGLVLSTKAAHTLKEAFEKYQPAMEIVGQVNASSEGFVEGAMDTELRTANFDIFYLIAVQCEALMNLLCSAELEIWYTLGTAQSKFVLTVENSDIYSSTFAVCENVLPFVLEVNELLQLFINPFGVETTMYSSVDAGLKRYRLLHEMDTFSLCDFDAESLEDLDYVVLA